MTATLTLVPLPTSDELLTLSGDNTVGSAILNRELDEQSIQATAALQAITALAKSHTRGEGFSDDGTQCSEDIAAVITTAALRLFSNPSETKRIELGSYNTVPGSFSGWNLHEVLVLNSWRRRTA